MDDEEKAKQEFKEKLRSLSFRSRQPGPKVSVDHTDTAVVTTTEHWEDRQDLHVNMIEPITITADKDSQGD
jgi:hypothetical protein